jgi:hypothetical protein
MVPQVTWINSTLVLNVVAALLLLWRLWSAGLARSYRYLAFFLTAEAVQMVILLPVKSRQLYAYLYFGSTPILWIFYYAVVIELYRLTLEDYPGISSAGRRAVTWSMGLAVVISAATSITSFDVGAAQFPFLRIFFAVERSVVLGLLVFLVLIQLFLFRYHLNLSRNRRIYSAGYALYFGITISSDIILTQLLGGQVYVAFSVAVGIAGALILLAGSILIRKEGEIRKPVPELVDNSPERQRLQQQLLEMNRMLSKVARHR